MSLMNDNTSSKSIDVKRVIIGLIITFVCVAILSTIYTVITRPSIYTPEMMLTAGISEILFGFVGCVLCYHATRKHGVEKGLIIFICTLLFVAICESVFIAFGAWGIIGQSYEFIVGNIWLLDLPLMTSFSWFILLYSSYELVTTAFPNASRTIRSFLCGLFCTSVDLWLDPTTANSNLETGSMHNWIFFGHDVLIFDIPLYNFVGWLMMITCFTWLFDYFINRKEFNGRRALQFFGSLVILAMVVTFTLEGFRRLAWLMVPSGEIFPIDYPTNPILSEATIMYRSLVPVLLLGIILGFLTFILVNRKRAGSLDKAKSFVYLPMIAFLIFIGVLLLIVANIILTYPGQSGIVLTLVLIGMTYPIILIIKAGHTVKNKNVA
jgi:hypothetical protein